MTQRPVSRLVMSKTSTPSPPWRQHSAPYWVRASLPQAAAGPRDRPAPVPEAESASTGSCDFADEAFPLPADAVDWVSGSTDPPPERAFPGKPDWTRRPRFYVVWEVPGRPQFHGLFVAPEPHA